MRRANLSAPLRVVALVSRYLTNKLIRHGPLPSQQVPKDPRHLVRRHYRVLPSVSRCYPRAQGTFPCITRPFATLLAPEGAFACDLHVLAMPPAFDLSQDQTLHLIFRRPGRSRSAAKVDTGLPGPVRGGPGRPSRSLGNAKTQNPSPGQFRHVTRISSPAVRRKKDGRLCWIFPSDAPCDYGGSGGSHPRDGTTVHLSISLLPGALSPSRVKRDGAFYASSRRGQ